MNAPVESLNFDPANSLILSIDIQQRLAAAMDPDTMTRVRNKATAVLSAARLMDVPIIVTEQYPRGLGSTLPELLDLLGEAPGIIEKTSFSCHRVEGVRKSLADFAGRRVLVMGMETHVCVWQSVRDLLDVGHKVAVITDAVCSRTELDRSVGLELCRQAGATMISAESLLFVWVKDAKTEHFKAISRLVK